MLTSCVCKYEDFATDWYRRWAEALRIEAIGYDPFRPDRLLHRKHWEFVAISQALYERGMLAPGKRGCGFAVGLEPLPSLFAAHGVDILATDLPLEADHTVNQTASATTWSSTGQHAASLDALHLPHLIEQEDFRARVRFKPVDMRDLQLPWDESFDFIWSSCSIEHLGTLEDGFGFLKQSLALLRPGGVAVHTTEFNVSSNDDTVASGPFVIYRQRDVEALELELRKLRCGLSRFDPFAGDHPYDVEFDKTPFTAPHPLCHIKLDLVGHIATSMILIIRKGAA